MLVLALDAEEGEEHEEDKEVVHREGFLDEITCEELHGLLVGIAWVEELNAGTEEQGHANPDGCHDQGFAHADLMLALPAKRLQVDEQHDEHQHIE